MKPIFKIAMAGLLLVECTSDNEQKSSLNMLAAGTWQLNGILTTLQDDNCNESEINLFDLPSCPNCIKDDQIEISSNGIYCISLGEMRCENNTQIFKFPHDGTWKFTDGELALILNPGTKDSTFMIIDELTESTLRLSYQDTIPSKLFLDDTTIHHISILYEH